MIGQLSAALDVPLRVQRRLFTAAGFVPDSSELPLDSPALAQVNEAIELILAGHEPYPALVIDGGWDLVAANDAAYRLLADLPPTCSSRPSTSYASRSTRADSPRGSTTSTSGGPGSWAGSVTSTRDPAIPASPRCWRTSRPRRRTRRPTSSSR